MSFPSWRRFGQPRAVTAAPGPSISTALVDSRARQNVCPYATRPLRRGCKRTKGPYPGALDDGPLTTGLPATVQTQTRSNLPTLNAGPSPPGVSEDYLGLVLSTQDSTHALRRAAEPVQKIPADLGFHGGP